MDIIAVQRSSCKISTNKEHRSSRIHICHRAIYTFLHPGFVVQRSYDVLITRTLKQFSQTANAGPDYYTSTPSKKTTSRQKFLKHDVFKLERMNFHYTIRVLFRLSRNLEREDDIFDGSTVGGGCLLDLYWSCDCLRPPNIFSKHMVFHDVQLVS